MRQGLKENKKNSFFFIDVIPYDRVFILDIAATFGTDSCKYVFINFLLKNISITGNSKCLI